MEEAPLLGGMSGPEEEMVTDLFSAESPFVSENLALKTPVVVKHEEDEFHVFKDAYLSSADPKEPLLHAFNPPLHVDCDSQVKVELAVDGSDAEEMLPEYPSLPELSPLEDAALPVVAPQPQAYNVHFLSSLLAPHRSPAVVPLGAWAREGGAHPGVRVIPVRSMWETGAGPRSPGAEQRSETAGAGQDFPHKPFPGVEIKEAGGNIISNNPEEATFQNPLGPESCCKFPSSQEAEDASGCSQKKDSNPMVICQLKGGTQMLCIDNSGTRELKALHLVPQYQDQNNYLQSDVAKPMTTLVGRFLPVPAKLNLITQQLENGALPSLVNGSAFPSGSALPGPPKLTLAGVTLSSWDTKSKKPCNCTKSQCLKLYCDCFASGDFCNNCNCNNCCNNLRHEIQRFKAIKACLDRNPEAFQPKIGKGRLGDVKPRHNKGCNCRRSGCLKNYCECYEAKIMCSSICKCIGCKNYEESPERKTLMNMPNSMEVGGSEGSHQLSPAEFSGPAKFRQDRRSSSCISWEVVEAACACLLAQGEEAEKARCPDGLAEQMILEEFGRCLSQILRIEFKAKGLKLE
ncbi:tesmin isoform X1 [Mustela erminea]|uniref:tesmin isoform X1 n=1 Tax=Mustela erminea TaxID=36723 RepID=UPI001386A366|nr:tesmin isoform X1 [Mustela erminea]